MAVHVPWLADAARMTGYPVVEVGGWESRRHGLMRLVEGVVAHHTADGPSGNYPSLRIVRDGRAGLVGPLSQLGLGRDGTIFVIAAGQAWHAGASGWAGFWDLNDEFLGIEAESVGTRDDWTVAQRDAYPRLCAALLHYMRRGPDRLAGHKEVCRPAGRKIDPAFIDMDAMRGQVAWYLADPRGRIPRFANAVTPPPPPSPGVDLVIFDKTFLAVGRNDFRLTVPVGTASAAWGLETAVLSIVGNGPVTGTVYVQTDTRGIENWPVKVTVKDGICARFWKYVPNGATQLGVVLDAPSGGTVTIEGKEKRP